PIPAWPWRRLSSGVRHSTLDCLRMPARYAIANWKMNLPPEGIETYLKALGAGGNGAARIVVAPPFLYLKDVVSLARSRVAVGGQNCADQPSGPLTGEVSAPMLREC